MGIPLSISYFSQSSILIAIYMPSVNTLFYNMLIDTLMALENKCKVFIHVDDCVKTIYIRYSDMNAVSAILRVGR
jgi:hypothetical protein